MYMGKTFRDSASFGKRMEYNLIGKMLMDRVEQLALQEGAPYIGLASGIRRTEAHAFYERLGFQKTSF